MVRSLRLLPFYLFNMLGVLEYQQLCNLVMLGTMQIPVNTGEPLKAISVLDFLCAYMYMYTQVCASVCICVHMYICVPLSGGWHRVFTSVIFCLIF